jgi:hypothetical protein
MAIQSFLNYSKDLFSKGSYNAYNYSKNVATNTTYNFYIFIDRRTINYRLKTKDYVCEKCVKFNELINDKLNKIDNKLIALTHKVDNFFYQNYQNIIFPFLSFYLFKNAFNRVIIATIITTYIKGKNQSEISNPIVNNARFSLTVIGTLGLYLHLKLYPLSNAVLFNAPILSGFAIGSVLYDAYTRYIVKNMVKKA